MNMFNLKSTNNEAVERLSKMFEEGMKLSLSSYVDVERPLGDIITSQILQSANWQLEILGRPDLECKHVATDENGNMSFQIVKKPIELVTVEYTIDPDFLEKLK